MTAPGPAKHPSAGTSPGRLAPALEVTGLSVRLGRNAVLHDVSLSAAPGSWVTVVGANGAGKSTLLRAVSGVIRHAGTVRVDGTDIGALAPRDRARRLALVAQNPVLPPAMTVASYVLLGRLAHMGRLARESAEDLAAVADVLARLDAGHLAGRRLGSLSGGEAQRIAVARAVVQQAPVLLLDEPTSSLDIGHQLDVLDLVEDLRRRSGLTVVSTMHDLTLAARYAERLVLLSAGRVAVDGTPETVLTETNLARFYGAAVRVVHDDSGVVVLPARARTAGTRP
jgi:iron complex transport system ATP-binding protein